MTEEELQAKFERFAGWMRKELPPFDVDYVLFGSFDDFVRSAHESGLPQEAIKRLAEKLVDLTFETK